MEWHQLKAVVIGYLMMGSPSEAVQYLIDNKELLNGHRIAEFGKNLCSIFLTRKDFNISYDAFISWVAGLTVEKSEEDLDCCIEHSKVLESRRRRTREEDTYDWVPKGLVFRVRECNVCGRIITTYEGTKSRLEIELKKVK